MIDAEKVDLSNNEMKSFELIADPEKSTTTGFNLNYNKINKFRIDTNRLHANDNLTFFMRNYGNSHCGCLLEKLFNLKSKFSQLHFVFGETTCATPDNLKGHFVKNLESKDLMCEDGCKDFGSCECSTREFDKSVLLYCTNFDLNNFTLLDGSSKALDSSYNRLRYDLSNKSLSKLPVIPENFKMRVTEIRAENNVVHELEAANIRDYVKILDVRNNSLSVLSAEVVGKLKSMDKVFLSGNPWICDCKTFKLFDFLHDKTILIDYNDVSCENLDRRFSDVNFSDVCFNWTVLLICLALGLGLIGTMVGLFYKFKKDIKIFLYHHNMCLWFASEQELNKQKEFDGFFCFASLDDNLACEIIEKLEADPDGYKLAVGVRDWIAGDTIPELVSEIIIDITDF